MTDEERRRTIEFILEQQAQFAANIQRHEEYFQQLEEERIRDRPRMAELERSFQRLVELSAIYDNRADEVEFRVMGYEPRISTLEEAFQRLDRLVKKNQARLDRLEGNSPL